MVMSSEFQTKPRCTTNLEGTSADFPKLIPYSRPCSTRIVISLRILHVCLSFACMRRSSIYVTITMSKAVLRNLITIIIILVKIFALDFPLLKWDGKSMRRCSQLR